MNINLQYQGVKPGTEHQFLQPDYGWAHFDTILADENYRALKKITLILGIQFTRWDPTSLFGLSDEEIKVLVGKLFSEVNASGRVELVILVNTQQ